MNDDKVQTICFVRTFNNHETNDKASLIVHAKIAADGNSATVLLDHVDDAELSMTSRSLASAKLPPAPKEFVVRHFFNFCTPSAAEKKQKNNNGGSDANKNKDEKSKKPDDDEEEEDTVGVPVQTLQHAWERIGKPATEWLLRSSNQNFFITGGSGSGRSYLLLGAGQTRPEDVSSHGILFRCITEVLKANEESNKEEGTKASLTFTSLEVHQEKLFDLLAPRASQPDSGLKPVLSKDGYNCDLKAINITSLADATRALDSAEQSRSSLKLASGLSAPASFVIHTFHYRKSASSGLCQSSRLTIVDVPPRQTAKDMMTLKGDARLEQNHLNCGLTTLERALSSLASGQRPSFRDSKLTLILRNRLCSGLTYLLGSISPASTSYEATKTTLSLLAGLREASWQETDDADAAQQGASPSAHSPDKRAAAAAAAAASGGGGGAYRRSGSASRDDSEGGTSSPRAVLVYQSPEGQLMRKLDRDPTEVRVEIDKARQQFQAQIDKLNAELSRLHEFKRVLAYSLPDGRLSLKKPVVRAASK